MHTFVLRKCRIAIVNPSYVSNSTSFQFLLLLLYFFFFHSSSCIYRQFEHGITWIYTSLSTLFSLQLYSLFFFFSSKKNKEEQQLLSCALIHFITVHFTVCIFWNTVGVLIITCTINFWIFISGIMLDVILIYIEN